MLITAGQTSGGETRGEMNPTTSKCGVWAMRVGLIAGAELMGVWGDWQVGHLTAAEYAKKARSWAHALRLVDPTIKLVLCGREGSDDWDREILQGCLDSIDWLSIHF